MMNFEISEHAMAAVQRTLQVHTDVLARIISVKEEMEREHTILTYPFLETRQMDVIPRAVQRLLLASDERMFMTWEHMSKLIDLVFTASIARKPDLREGPQEAIYMVFLSVMK